MGSEIPIHFISEPSLEEFAVKLYQRSLYLYSDPQSGCGGWYPHHVASKFFYPNFNLWVLLLYP